MSFGTLQLVIRPPQNRFGWWGVGTIALAILVFLWWAAVGSQINASNLWNGIPYMWDFLVRMVPPNPEFLDRLWKPALESLQVAVWGTLLGVVIALPICFFAARNLSPSPAVFPLAIPLMAGPGALTAAVLLGGQAGGDWLLRGLFAGVIAIVLVLCLCVFLLSGPIERLMGERAQNVLGRLLGVLLAALAVQYVADGVAAFKLL